MSLFVLFSSWWYDINNSMKIRRVVNHFLYLMVRNRVAVYGLRCSLASPLVCGRTCLAHESHKELHKQCIRQSQHLTSYLKFDEMLEKGLLIANVPLYMRVICHITTETL